MAFWGMDLHQCDEFCEVYDEYMDMYDMGTDVCCITPYILKKYLTNSGRDHNVYFAVAKAQWKLCSLSSDIYKTVNDIVESTENLEYYRSLGFSENEICARASNLSKFINLLQTPPKQPKKRRINQSNKFKVLPKGTVSWYEADGGYYGSVVLDAVYEGRLLAISEKLPYPPKDPEMVLDLPALTVIWLMLRNAPKMHRIIGNLEIYGSFNGRAGMFICKPISFGVNFTMNLDECHKRALVEFRNLKMCDLLNEENIPVKFFNEDTMEKETEMVLDHMKNPASVLAKNMIERSINLSDFIIKR